MSEAKEQPKTRREFFTDIGRWVGVAAIVGSGAYLLARNPASLAASQECMNEGVCRGCPALDRCRLPSGESFREMVRRDANG